MEVKYEYSGPEITYKKMSCDPVDAIYHKVKGYEGNPFVEALPFFSEEKSAIIDTFTNDPRERGFTPSGPNASIDIRLGETTKLRQVVFPLPCYRELISHWNSNVKESLRIRWENFHNVPYSVTIKDQTARQNGFIRKCADNDGDVGIMLTGPSGSGKNTAICSILKKIPRLLMHHFETGTFLQIVWLFVTTPQGGSLQDLYYAIARAVDELLDNMNGFYASEIKKMKSIDEKANYVVNLIQRFGIGALIIDEVQNLDFTKNAGSSFRSLTTIENYTKISIISLGLESAMDKLYFESYTARRAGHSISTIKLETDRDRRWFITSISEILEYQWTNKHVKITTELIDTILEVSGYVIDDIVKIWIDVQRICLQDSSGKCLPTPELIREAAKKYAPVKRLRDAERADAFYREKNADDFTSISNRETYTVAPITERKPFPTNETMLENVMSATKYVLKIKKAKGEFTDNMIKEAAEKIMQKKANNDLDEDELVRKTISLLEKKTNTSRTKKAPVLSDIKLTDTLQNYTEANPLLF